jgi:hypothetical protein
VKYAYSCNAEGLLCGQLFDSIAVQVGRGGDLEVVCVEVVSRFCLLAPVNVKFEQRSDEGRVDTSSDRVEF